LAARIRLQRAGRKKRPFYRIVVADRAANRDGRFVERLGHYDPVPAEIEFVLNEERALYWLSMGAEPTDTVRSLMRRSGVWAKFKGVETAPPELSTADADPAPVAKEAAPPVVDDTSDEDDGNDDTAEE
jgi:small subunit ribosomal protein S16